jgi:hypothetical protein
MNDLILKCESELAGAINAIQQPRTSFQLAHFVVGQHDTEPRRWWQCVLELQLKIQNLKRIQIERRRTMRRVEVLEHGDEDARDEAALLRLGVEETDLAILGAVREVQALYGIFKSFARSYTREELDAAEAEYWQKRLVRQARHEISATGAIGVGNQDALEQIGILQSPLLAEVGGCLEQLEKLSVSPLQLADMPRPDLKT